MESGIPWDDVRLLPEAKNSSRLLAGCLRSPTLREYYVKLCNDSTTPAHDHLGTWHLRYHCLQRPQCDRITSWIIDLSHRGGDMAPIRLVHCLADDIVHQKDDIYLKHQPYRQRTCEIPLCQSLSLVTELLQPSNLNLTLHNAFQHLSRRPPLAISLVVVLLSCFRSLFFTGGLPWVTVKGVCQCRLSGKPFPFPNCRLSRMKTRIFG